MDQSRLRAHTGMRYPLFDPILKELAKEARIRMSGEMITLL